MSYKTLMVHLDLERSIDTLLPIAGDLATRFGAALIGTAAADITPPLYFAEGDAGAEVIKMERTWLEGLLKEREAEFRRVLHAWSGPLEWRSALEWPAGFVARNARVADLLIVGGRTGHGTATRDINPGEIAIRAGRPVLFVPAGATWLKLATVVVAWKDTREARRAVNDALPLLHLAREVVVVELLEKAADQRAGQAGVGDVARWHNRRGINASSISTKALIGVTSQLSIIAHDEGADIIVAGAYGHTRFQEWLFGGVTHELLTQQEHCVLLSH